MRKKVNAFKYMSAGLALMLPLCGVFSNAVNANESPANAGDTGSLTMDLPVYDNEQAGILNIGSVSKVYAVTAVMQLVDEGKVELDAPVTDYIPDFKMADERYKDITVRMLMNHTSGLMGSMYGEIFLFDEMKSDYHDGLLKNLESQYLKADPGAFNCYCNDGFTLLEILVERVAGMSFTDYVEKNICRPLSLTETGSAWDMDVNTQVPIYVNDNVMIPSECGQTIGAGGIMSNAQDVCAFGSAFFTGNSILLSEEAKEAMADSYRTGGCAFEYGLGWDVTHREDYDTAGVQVLSKGGDTFFQHASLVVAPDEEISIAVLSSGGGSGINEKLALEILDLALEENGILIEHPEEKKPETIEEVPDRYLEYEGLYANASMMVNVSFPEGKYMQITSVNCDSDFEFQYMYTTDGNFVRMRGDVASGNAIVSDPVESFSFEVTDGRVFITQPEIGYYLYMISGNDAGEKALEAWNERDEVTYYYVSGTASDATYMMENRCFMLHTSDMARGYVNGYRIVDENHADYEYIIPGDASRDISNLRMETVNGKEYLYLDAFNMKYISEECIPVLSSDIEKVDLKSGEAGWFRIEDMKNVTLSLDIPEDASAYVFDKYGNLKYSSMMRGYGNAVPLPENGMMVFVGENGTSVTLNVSGQDKG
jgi:CubicO group peptidase (beta-lactamase class C family)